MNDTILSIQGITKMFGEHAVIEKCSINIQRGEIIGLIGPSGCGKTTLLKIICGLIQPDEGMIEFQQEQLEWSGKPFKEMTYLFQKPVLYPHLNVIKNVMLGIHRSKTRTQRKEAALQSLEFTNISHLSKRNINNLSGGESQRVAFARAHAQNPKLMLLDEPFSSVDETMKLDLAQEFRTWMKSNKNTALFVTHDVREAEIVADRIIDWNHLHQSDG